MSEILTQEIAVGDQVRVHFHPPGAWKSFSEGVVRRVDVTTQAGRFFVVEVTHEVILDREHRIRPGFLDYVRYECRNDFPGRIEVLATTEQDMETEPASLLTTAATPEVTTQEADEQPVLEADACHNPEVELSVEPEADAEPHRVHLEHQPVRKQGVLIAALFGRKK
jgi:hypothetical protein